MVSFKPYILCGLRGSGLYYVESEGGRLKGERFSVGSGSPYAYGVLDNGYHHNLSVEEAAELARRAIYCATLWDGASGGVSSGSRLLRGSERMEKLSVDDVGELHYKYYPVMPCQAQWNMKWLKFLALDSFLLSMSSFRAPMLMAFLKSYTA